MVSSTYQVSPQRAPCRGRGRMTLTDGEARLVRTRYAKTCGHVPFVTCAWMIGAPDGWCGGWDSNPQALADNSV